MPHHIATTDEGANSSWDEQPAVGVPEGKNYPTLWKKDKDETTAAAIVRAVEERLVDAETQKVWLPYRLWTLEDRKGRSDTKLTKYLAAYYFIRHMNKGEKPEDIRKNLAAMAKDAVAATSKSILTNKWYHLTLEVYEEVSSSPR